MLLADTNLLVRHFVQDDPVQGPLATRYIQRTADKGDSLGVTDLVFGELFWVLLRRQGLPKDEVLKVAIAMLADPVYQFEDHERAAMTVGLWAEKNTDFTDSYLAAKCRSGEADGVVSFDQDFKRLPVRWVQP